MNRLTGAKLRRLQELAATREYSQRQLAQRFGVSQVAVSKALRKSAALSR